MFGYSIIFSSFHNCMIHKHCYVDYFTVSEHLSNLLWKSSEIFLNISLLLLLDMFNDNIDETNNYLGIIVSLYFKNKQTVYIKVQLVKYMYNSSWFNFLNIPIIRGKSSQIINFKFAIEFIRLISFLIFKIRYKRILMNIKNYFKSKSEFLLSFFIHFCFSLANI